MAHDQSRFEACCTGIQKLLRDQNATNIERINVLMVLLAEHLRPMPRPARLSAVKHLRKLSASHK